MPDINRSLIIVKAKQPFLDWAHSIDPEDDTTLDDLNHEPTAYLLQEYEMDDEQAAILDWYADIIFEYELWHWCSDKQLWPRHRDAATFREWFEVKFHSMVIDIVTEVPLKHIDYSDASGDLDPSSNGH